MRPLRGMMMMMMTMMMVMMILKGCVPGTAISVSIRKMVMMKIPLKKGIAVTGEEWESRDLEVGVEAKIEKKAFFKKCNQM